MTARSFSARDVLDVLSQAETEKEVMKIIREIFPHVMLRNPINFGKQDLIDAGAIPVLCNMMRKWDNDFILNDLILISYYLCDEFDVKLDFVKEGFLDILVNQIKKSECPEKEMDMLLCLVKTPSIAQIVRDYPGIMDVLKEVDESSFYDENGSLFDAMMVLDNMLLSGRTIKAARC